MKAVFIATMETRNFTFTAASDTAAVALAALGDALAIHAKQYGLPADWWGVYDVNVKTMAFGTAYRDGEALT